MNDLWKAVIPGIIAAITAAIGGYWGYNRWKRERQEAKSKDFVTERRSAHKAVWEQMENVHAGIRMGTWSQAELAKQLQSLNVQILRLEPYLDSELHPQVNEYFDALIAFANLIKKEGGEGARVSFSGTQAAMPEPGNEKIRDQEYKVNYLRSGLVQKFGAVLRGENS